MKRKGDAEIIARMTAATNVSEKLRGFQKESLRRAGRVDPFPGTRVFTLVQNFQALSCPPNEDAMTTAGRVLRIAGGRLPEHIKCRKCGGAIRPGMTACGACGSPWFS